MVEGEETKIGGEISLVGFDSLEPMDLIVVKKIIGTYVKQLSEKTDYKSLKLQLRVHPKGKSTLNELSAQAIMAQGTIGSKIEDYNLYQALSKILETILAEAVHKHRKAKEIGKGFIREQQKKERKEKSL